MDIDNIKAFIKYGVFLKETRKSLMALEIGLSLFSLLGAVGGLFFDDITTFCSVIIFAFAIYGPISAYVITKKIKSYIKTYIFFFTNSCVHIIISFSLISFILLYSEAKINIIVSVLITCIPLIFLLLSLFFTHRKIKKRFYLNSNNWKGYESVAYAAGGGAVGYPSVRFLMSKFPQHAVALAIIALFLMLCFIAIGTAIYFMKVYYIKVLESQGIDIEK